MASVSISFADQIMQRHGAAFEKLGAGGTKKVLRLALNRAGQQAKTGVTRALVPQTGLKGATIRKAVKRVSVNSSADDLSYTLMTKGGNIRLKYFKARETRRGVSAAPWNQRQVFASTFQRAGWWRSGRVDKPNWNRQVFERVGGTTKGFRRLRSAKETWKNSKSRMDRFKVVRSDLYIPEEMIKGRSLAAWQSVMHAALTKRIAHELARSIPGMG